MVEIQQGHSLSSPHNNLVVCKSDSNQFNPDNEMTPPEVFTIT